jgi:mono/diheme cytochrome c family protein
VRAFLPVILASTVLAGCVCSAPSPTVPATGEALFRSNCSGCHGLNAQGNGPVAEFLTAPVPDLTQIAARRGGRFPEDDVFRIIDGQSAQTVHGLRHMPIWGYEFFGNDADDESAHRAATQKVDRLVAYLRSIQRNR